VNRPTAHRLSGLGQRFDKQALQPPQAASALAGADKAVLPALQAWCLSDSGPGCSRWTRPLTQPAIDQRLKIATLGPATPCALATAEQLCLQLDGSLRMAGSGPLGRLQLRLMTKLNDAMWWRALRPTDPWDCGHVRATPAGMDAMRGFIPRRATLMVASGLTPALRQELLSALQQRQADWPHAVRLLLIGHESSGEVPMQGFSLAPCTPVQQGRN
jgi:hypothetical protein